MCIRDSSIDLAAEWKEHTGLPFVFAFWAGYAGTIDVNEIEALQAAKEAGVAHVDEITRAYATERGGDPALYRRYLSKHIHFSLGEDEIEGLRLFYVKACQHNLIDLVPSLDFFS